MPLLARITVIAALAAAAIMVTSQMLGGPARYVIIAGHSMEPALHTGDLAFVVTHASYRRGDVVAFRIPKGQIGAGAVVIHRVIGGTDDAGYLTQGDNRDGRDPWRPKHDDVVGKVAFHIPRAGLLAAFLGSPLGLGLAAGALAFLFITGGGKARSAEHPPEPRAQPRQAPRSPSASARAVAPAIDAVTVSFLVTTGALGAIALVAASAAHAYLG